MSRYEPAVTFPFVNRGHSQVQGTQESQIVRQLRNEETGVPAEGFVTLAQLEFELRAEIRGQQRRLVKMFLAQAEFDSSLR